MSSLSTEQLVELTERINARLGEFDIVTMPTLTKGVVRLVHDVVEEWWNVDEVEEWWNVDEVEQREVKSLEFKPADHAPQAEADLVTKFKTLEVAKPTAIPVAPPDAMSVIAVADDPTRYTGPVPTLNGVPALVTTSGHTESLSTSAAATLGPEHTIVTPFKPTGRTLAEVDGIEDEVLPNLDKEGKAALLREIIGELQMLSQSGEMPSMKVWDERKPNHLPKAQATCMRYNLNWGQLAGYAKLKPSPRSGNLVGAVEGNHK